MKRSVVFILTVILLVSSAALCSAQTSSISEQSMQESSQDSSQQSSEDSLQNSTDESSQATTQESSDQSSENSTQNSFQYTTDESSVSSNDSTQQTSGSSEQSGDAFVVTMIVGGAVVSVGLTVFGISYIVDVAGASKTDVLAFQDEIYAACGPDYEAVVTELQIPEVELVRANDELVANGLTIASDKDAADYLGALMLRLAPISPVVNSEPELANAG